MSPVGMAFFKSSGIINKFPMLFSRAVIFRRQPGILCQCICRGMKTSQQLNDTHVVKMPSLSPTMTEGTIVKWLKKEGDAITPGDAICEIQTDKAVVTLDWDDEGILAKIIMPENSVDVKVGSLIALTCDEGDDWKTVTVPAGEESPASSTPPPSSATPQAAATSSVVEFPSGAHKVLMPSLSPTMTEGTIVQWLKSEGDKISAGDAICEIQTDKAVVTLDSDDDAILAKILAPAGTTDVKVGTLIAVTVDEDVDWKNLNIPTSVHPPPAATSSSPTAVKSKSPESTSDSYRHLLGPAVNLLLKRYGLNISQVSGSGPHGTVNKGDVLKFVADNKLKPVPQDVSPKTVSEVPTSTTATQKRSPKGLPAQFIEIEVSNMRRTIAKRLLQSKSTVPHAYAVSENNVNRLLEVRRRLISEGLKVSVNDILIKCVGNALLRVPGVNAVWESDQIVSKGHVDVSVAVATPAGLITPIIFDVINNDVVEISSKMKVLATKAKDGKLQPNEFMGGTFSISNLGMFGIHSFTAIINPPQCAILAVGGTISNIDENGAPLNTVKLALSYDARAIGDDDATKFLAHLRHEIESVNELALGIYSVDSKKESMTA